MHVSNTCMHCKTAVPRACNICTTCIVRHAAMLHAIFTSIMRVQALSGACYASLKSVIEEGISLLCICYASLINMQCYRRRA